MGGSGGGGGTSRLSGRDLESIREQAQERLERNRNDSEINSLLQHELASINERDVDLVRRRLDAIQDALAEDVVEIDRILFGGSVAKRTYVDGLSDVDSLLVFDPGAVGDQSPQDVRSDVRETLEGGLNRGDVESIRSGNLAITVRYRDGLEIQLLPAVGQGDEQLISSASGERWIKIQPRKFADRLTRVNEDNGGGVIPAIKLAKAIIAGRLPEGERPTGYHVEALALAAFDGYNGPRTPKAMVERLFDAAARSAMEPISDVTGQSVHVDESLGPAGSPSRQRLSSRFRQIAKDLTTAKSASEWQKLFPE
jgi:Second Messenger Oligonucleotide or Dinucleotide Synthetase domain